MYLFDANKFSGINFALSISDIPDHYVESRFSRKLTKIFKSPPPIDIDELLPDKFFDWDKIGIK